MASLTILRVEPEDICFPNLLYQSFTSKMTLKNVSAGNVAYKVKTTAPKRFMVRPSTGILVPSESVDVQVVLHPLSSYPSGNTDGFQVQATPTTRANNETLTRDEWTEISKNSIQEKRLSVIFSFPSVNDFNNPDGVKIVDTASVSAPDLRSKYEELVQYTLGLQKEKVKIEQELLQIKVPTFL